MFLLLTLVMALTAFLGFELRLTEASADRRRAQLVAYSGLRMALAHLQQEAGADQRITAQANATGPGDVIENTDQWLKYWERRNPYWTAIWDSRLANQGRPPAWLVSGEKQLHSRAVDNVKKEYEGGYNTPWEVHEDSDDRVTLVSKQKEKKDVQTFDSTVTVRSIPVHNAEDQIMGRVAYWVGDEGVKARLNLRDKYREERANSARGQARLLASRNAIELYPDWGAVNNTDENIDSVLDAAGFLNLKGVPRTSNVHSYKHTVTAHSQGLQTSARWGGLKHDMSLIFEDNLSLDDFNEQFGNKQSKFPVTLNIKAKYGNAKDQEVRSDSTATWDNWEKVKMVIADRDAGPNGRPANPLYSLDLGMVDSAYDGMVQSWVRGPSWELLRNYYRLYKDETDPEGGRGNFVNGKLRARTFYPSASTLNNIRGMESTLKFPFTYSWLYNTLSMVNGSANATQTDRVNFEYFGKHAILRPTKVAITPHLSRYILMLTARAVSGEEKKKKIQLVLNPVIVLHNPYNVPIYLSGKTSYPLRYSQRNAVFEIEVEGKGRSDLTQLFGLNNSLETLHSLIPSTLMQPGEYRVFSSQHPEPVPSIDNVLSLSNNYFPNAGIFFDNILDGGKRSLEISEGESLNFIIRLKAFNPQGEDNTSQMNQSKLQVYEMIDSWEPDDIGVKSGDQRNSLAACSIHGEIVIAGNRAYFGGRPLDNIVVRKTMGYEQTDLPLAFADFFEKTLQWPNDYKFYNSLSYPKPSDMFNGNSYPSFIMSNPLAPVYAKYAQMTMGGYAITSPSWQFCFGGEGVSDWGGVVEMPGPGRAFGGYSLASSSVGAVVPVAVPRAPLLSLGQFQHAPLGVVDHMPSLGAGHALPSPLFPVNVISRGACWPYNNHDFSWLMNTALWDRYYFSTIAPKVNSAENSKPPVVVSKQDAVWNDFIAHKASLVNPFFLLNPYSDKNEQKSLLSDKYAWYKSAAHLLQEGTFNVNAMDYRAWETVLGGTKGAEVAAGKVGTEAVGTPDKIALPRANPAVASREASKNITAEEAWTGAKLLDTKQIEQLSKSIIEVIRRRFSHEHNQSGHVDKDHKVEISYFVKNGSSESVELCRPFFSLAEFVNRCVNPNANGDTKDDFVRLGVVQHALFQADKRGANINSGLIDGKVLRKDMLDKGGEDNAFYYPNSLAFTDSYNQVPLAGAASGMTLQGDIFQAIGSRLNVRSDTFIVRAYGTMDGKISGRVAGRAWLEAVVQRYPDYLWTGNDPQHGKQTADIAPEKANDPEGRTLNAVNRYFGRRFRVVSVRWLSADEV
jgi:hypothetical protein